MTPQERYKKLKQHLSEENPVLLDVIKRYETLDAIAHSHGFLDPEDTYTAHISWWPLISILGTFSSGKSTFINQYLGMKVQSTGNQAVDDKFTVICYGTNDEVMTLPGLALDADPRFPFYNISEEVEKVDAGEGSRVNLYLQLKTVRSDAVKGKILIDSPGFDADSQRDAILRITSHIIDMSDLVLIFFDARHPEPGAMRDTLEHLVGAAISHRDANKILYILNQIDTTAKEDNLEDVIGSWQRALSQKGLVSGNFFAIYSEESMVPIEDAALAERMKRKRDEDLRQIVERMDKVGIERAYRITKALEDFARDISDRKLPALQKALAGWAARVAIVDAVLFTLLLGGIGVLEWQFGFVTTVASSPLTAVAGMALLIGLMLFLHFKARNFVARRIFRKLEAGDPAVAAAFAHNTRWYRPMVRAKMTGWVKRAQNRLEEVIAQSKRAIRELNDQYVSPSGRRHGEES
ncbi:dynamin family protein [Hydrogenimonas sp.]